MLQFKTHVDFNLGRKPIDDGREKKRRRVQRACDMCRVKRGTSGFTSSFMKSNMYLQCDVGGLNLTAQVRELKLSGGGGKSSQRPCSSCVENNLNCTYTQVSKVRPSFPIARIYDS